MTHSSEATAKDGPETPAATQRALAYESAVRHTSRVRFLRKAILFGSLAAIASIVGLTLFDPFSRLPKDLSVGQVRLNGTRVTLELPKLSGFRQDGKPYDVRATSGVQDVRKPNIVELTEIEARFETTDQATVRLTSPQGVYDSSREFMQLRGDVRITSTKGFDVRMTNADMDFKAGTVISNEPVTVVSGNGTVAADRVTIIDSGKKITFEGHVKSRFNTGLRGDVKGNPK